MDIEKFLEPADSDEPVTALVGGQPLTFSSWDGQSIRCYCSKTFDRKFIAGHAPGCLLCLVEVAKRSNPLPSLSAISSDTESDREVMGYTPPLAPTSSRQEVASRAEDPLVDQHYVLKTVNLAIFKPLGILVCTRCRETVCPADMCTHVKQTHPRRSQSMDSRQYAPDSVALSIAYLKTHETLTSPPDKLRENIRKLPTPYMPIPHVKVLGACCQCTYCNEVIYPHTTGLEHLETCSKARYSLVVGSPENSPVSDRLVVYNTTQRVNITPDEYVYIAVSNSFSKKSAAKRASRTVELKAKLAAAMERIRPGKILNLGTPATSPDKKPLNNLSASTLAPQETPRLRVSSLPVATTHIVSEANALEVIEIPSSPSISEAEKDLPPVEQAIANARRILNNQLLHGLDVRRTGFRSFRTIFDDVECSDNGYSFLDDDHNRYQEYSTALYAHLESTGFISPANFAVPAMDWLGYAGEFVDELREVVRGICPADISEMALANLRIRNMNGVVRNVFVSMDFVQVRFSGQNGKVIRPVHLPASATELVLIYLVFVRPVECRFASELSNTVGGPSVDSSHTAFETFLFMKDPRRTMIIS